MRLTMGLSMGKGGGPGIPTSPPSSADIDRWYDLSQENWEVTGTDITRVFSETDPGDPTLNFTPVGSGRPQTGRSFSGLSTMDHQAHGDMIQTSTPAFMQSTDVAFCISYVIAIDALDGTLDDPMFMGNTTGSDPAYYFRVRSASGGVRHDLTMIDTLGNRIDHPGGSGLECSFGEVAVVTMRCDGTDYYFYKNGVLSNTSSLSVGSMSGANRWSVGGAYPNTSTFDRIDGAFGEIILYNRDLTAGELGDLHDYLTNKWL